MLLLQVCEHIIHDTSIGSRSCVVLHAPLGLPPPLSDLQYSLVGSLSPLADLREEYKTNVNQVFVGQMDWLIEQGYVGIRRTSADGMRVNLC